MNETPAHLLLKNQICFPLYAASRLITRMYQPLLDALQITYTQYLVMLVLWEHDSLSVSQIGQQLYLESNTLTPLLKKLEQKQLIMRSRQQTDERTVMITLTEQGRELQNQASCIPEQLAKSVDFSEEELLEIRESMWKILDHLQLQMS